MSKLAPIRTLIGRRRPWKAISLRREGNYATSITLRGSQLHGATARCNNCSNMPSGSRRAL